MKRLLHWRLEVCVVAATATICTSAAAQPTSMPASRPDRAAIQQEVRRIATRLDKAREQAMAVEEYKKALEKADKIWWEKGNAQFQGFEARDKRVRELQNQIKELNKQLTELQRDQEFFRAQGKVRNDPDYMHAQAAAKQLLDDLLEQIEPQYQALMKRQDELVRQLPYSTWPQMKRQISTQPVRRFQPPASRPAPRPAPR